MRTKTWVYSPPKPKVPDAVKVELRAKAMELVTAVLKPEHIKPPPKNAKWNYIVDIYVQPLKLPILRVRVPPQELPIYLGSNIRLRRR